MPPRIRIHRLAPTESTRRADWLAALRDFEPESAAVLKRDRDSAVYRATLVGRDVVIKAWSLRSPMSRLRTLVRASRGDRHWHAAHWLAKHRIPSAGVFVLATKAARGTVQLLLVMEALPGKTVLQHLADRDLSVRQEHAVAAAVGQQIAALMHLRHYNRDPKPSNQIVTALAADAATIALIDCVGIKRTLWFDSDEPIPMFARIVIEPIGVGLRPRRALLMRALRSYCDAIDTMSGQRPIPKASRRAILRNAWRDIAEFINLHGDPTPRINPLSPPT